MATAYGPADHLPLNCYPEAAGIDVVVILTAIMNLLENLVTPPTESTDSRVRVALCARGDEVIEDIKRILELSEAGGSSSGANGDNANASGGNPDAKGSDHGAGGSGQSGLNRKRILDDFRNRMNARLFVRRLEKLIIEADKSKEYKKIAVEIKDLLVDVYKSDVNFRNRTPSLEIELRSTGFVKTLEKLVRRLRQDIVSSVSVDMDKDVEEDGGKKDGGDVGCDEPPTQVASYVPEPDAFYNAEDVDVDKKEDVNDDRKEEIDVTRDASISGTSTIKEIQLRLDVQRLGFTSWDVKYDPSRTLVVGDVKSSEKQLHFVFFHPEAIIGLFGCGFKLPFSKVSILLDKQKVLMQEMAPEEWKWFWKDAYKGPFKLFLFGRKEHAMERTAELLETEMLHLNKNEALSKLGISVDGSQFQEFVGSKRSKAKGAEGDVTWEPSWKSWVKAVIDHSFPDSSAPTGLLKNVAELTSKGFPIHTANEWSEERVVDANPTASAANKADPGSGQKMTPLRGETSAVAGQESKTNGGDETDVGSPQEKKAFVTDDANSRLGEEEKKLVVIVKFLGHDAPYFEYESGKPREISRDQHNDLPVPGGPGGQTSSIQPELTVEFFRPVSKTTAMKSIATRLDVEDTMGEIIDPTFRHRDAWFQNCLFHSFTLSSANKRVAQRRFTQHNGLKNVEQPINNDYEASTLSQNTGKLSGNISGNFYAFAGTGGGSQERQTTEKFKESGQIASKASHKVLDDFPLFDVQDHCMPHRMSYTAIYNLHQEKDPSEYYYTNPMKTREKQGSGLQTRVALQAEAKWDLYGESTNDYEFEARKWLSRTTETPSKNTGLALKGWVNGVSILPYNRVQTKVVSQVFTKRFTINHKFSDIFDAHLEYEQNDPHVWDLYCDPCPVPVAMTKAASQREDASTQAAVGGTATHENQEENDDGYIDIQVSPEGVYH